MLPESERIKFFPKNSTLGQRIAYARRKANMSRFELACELGSLEDAIYQYESDEKVPHIVTLKCMSEILRVSREWLGRDGPLRDEIFLQSTIVRMRMIIGLKSANLSFKDFAFRLKRLASSPIVSRLPVYESILIELNHKKAATQFLDPEEPVPSLEVLRSIAEMLGVDYDWLSRELPTIEEKEDELMKVTVALVLVDRLTDSRNKRQASTGRRFSMTFIAILSGIIIIDLFIRGCPR